MIRKLSGEAFRTGQAGALSKYARQGRTTYSVEHVKYTKQCTEIWKRQRRILTIEEPPACSASDSDSPDDDMMEDMMKDVEDELERAPGASGAALGNARGLFKKGGLGGLPTCWTRAVWTIWTRRESCGS
jgi:hypothetical protein